MVIKIRDSKRSYSHSVIEAGITPTGLANLKQFAGKKEGRSRQPNTEVLIDPVPGPDPIVCYPGQFPIRVASLIKSLISPPALHLFSGRSDIGDERIDLECPEATQKMSVEQFITTDDHQWQWVILDPPYRLIDTSILRPYRGRESLSGNAILRDRLCLYFRSHAENVLWLDYCAPTIPGFARHHLYFILPPRHFENIRVMSWLKRNQAELGI